MPVLHGDMSKRPDWCELEQFAIVAVTGSGHVWKAGHPANKLVVVDGNCLVDGKPVDAGGSVDAGPGWYAVEGPGTVAELGGHWSEDCGGAGVFGVVRADERPP